MILSKYKYSRFIMPVMAFLLLFTLLFSIKCDASAAVGFEYYSYDKLYAKLPDKFKTTDYIYVSDGIPLITFATYNGHDYRTSVKKSDDKNDFIYCCDYSKHIVFGKVFTEKNNLFNNELRARIGTALHYGTNEWGQKAASDFTTGNFVTDYYMTQVVIHSLIYKYGGDLSSYGVDFSKLSFKSNTGTIKKKAKALYDFCCNSTISTTDGNYQNPQFSFNKPQDNTLMLYDGYLYSNFVSCNSIPDGAIVKSYLDTVSSSSISRDLIEIERKSDAYDSEFRIKIPVEDAVMLNAGVYEVSLTRTVEYERHIAGFWKSSNNESQETTGFITNIKELSDNVVFKFIVGEISLKKTDSMTGENISDASFTLNQYNGLTNGYEPYITFQYNDGTKSYESGKFVKSAVNLAANFTITETAAAKNYKNDWEGAAFNLTEDNYIFELGVENEPVLGSLTVTKKGENVTGLKNNKFVYDNDISLEGVTFSLYADSDIYKKNTLLFKKGDYIANFVTDSKGKATVRNLPLGDYYFKETKTLDTYKLDPDEHRFTITRDDKRKYIDLSYDVINILKKCQINIYKCDEEKGKKYPLANAVFGLYCAEPIYDFNKKIILEKDSLIAQGTTDNNGNALFTDLPYADYYIKELKAPEGYILNDGITLIKKTDFKIDKDNSKFEKNVDIINLKQLFCLNIHKMGEQFTGVEKQVSENGEYYQYTMQQKPLEKVTFSLYSENGELIGKKETNEKGIAIFSGLTAGKYYYIEDSCPEVYAKKKEKTEVVIKPDSNKQLNVYVDETIKDAGQKKQPIFDSTINNNYCDVSLSIRKNGEAVNMNESGLNYTTIPLSNIVFGIYQNFDYVITNDILAPKDMCVGYLVTMEDGTASFKGKIPEGQYYIKEIKTAIGYDIDTNLYYFDVKGNQHETIEIRLDNQNEFINYLSKASVQIVKTNSNTGKKLKGVEFTLYNEAKQQIGVYKTDKKGTIIIPDLPYGNYYFVETKAKHGYYATNNRYKFTIDSPEGVVLNITNAPILKLGFEEHYKHALIALIIIIAAFSSIICTNKFRCK